jgi:hypothetical protein
LLPSRTSYLSLLSEIATDLLHKILIVNVIIRESLQSSLTNRAPSV